MGKAPCCDKDNVKRGPWSPEEDYALKSYIHHHGTGGNWIALPKKAGLRRCGKSCRLRWLNYLRPDIRHGSFTEEEDMIIYTLYSQMGSRWSIIASQLHGRTDNDVKNHWNTKLKKKLLATKNNNIGEYPNPNDNPTLIGSTHFQPCTSNIENYTNLGFSALLTQDFQGTPTMLGDVNYGLTSQKFVHDPIHFTCPIIPNLPQFNANAVENHIVSTSQEASIGLDEKCVPWTSNIGGGGGDGILMDFGFGFSNEFVNGLWSLEKGGEGGAPNLVSSLGDSSHVLHADINPRGLLQSVINH